MNLDEIRLDNGSLPTYAWPGGYPLYYVTRDSGVLCPTDANSPEAKEATADPDPHFDPQWAVIGVDTNWEDPDLRCDHCGNRIESAYAEDAP